MDFEKFKFEIGPKQNFRDKQNCVAYDLCRTQIKSQDVFIEIHPNVINVSRYIVRFTSN